MQIVIEEKNHWRLVHHWIGIVQSFLSSSVVSKDLIIKEWYITGYWKITFIQILQYFLNSFQETYHKEMVHHIHCLLEDYIHSTRLVFKNHILMERKLCNVGFSWYFKGCFSWMKFNLCPSYIIPVIVLQLAFLNYCIHTDKL